MKIVFWLACVVALFCAAASLMTGIGGHGDAAAGWSAACVTWSALAIIARQGH